MVPKWFKYGLKWYQNSPKMVQKWFPKWSKNGLQTNYKLWLAIKIPEGHCCLSLLCVTGNDALFSWIRPLKKTASTPWDP